MSVVSDASKTCLNFNKSIEIPVTHKKNAIWMQQWEILIQVDISRLFS